MRDRAGYEAARAEQLQQRQSKKRILHALGRLLDAAYLDEAPTRDQREAWKEAAAEARRGMDQMARRLAALEKVVGPAGRILRHIETGRVILHEDLAALRAALAALDEKEVGNG